MLRGYSKAPARAVAITQLLLLSDRTFPDATLALGASFLSCSLNGVY